MSEMSLVRWENSTLPNETVSTELQINIHPSPVVLPLIMSTIAMDILLVFHQEWCTTPEGDADRTLRLVVSRNNKFQPMIE